MCHERADPFFAAKLGAALHGNAVAEAGGSGVFAGANFEIHLAHSLAAWSCEWAKHAAGADWRLHRFIDHAQVRTIAEFEVSLDRVGGLFGGLRCEEQLVTAVGLVDAEIRVPVRAA